MGIGVFWASVGRNFVNYNWMKQRDSVVNFWLKGNNLKL